MFRKLCLAGVVLVVLSAGALAKEKRAPGPVGSPSGPINEQVWWVPMEQPRQRGLVHLETTVYRPNGPGPFPLILLNHGSPRDAASRRSTPRTRYFDQSSWFVEQNYAVVIPMRRGYASSEGEWSEAYNCNNADYWNAGLSTANDIGAVLAYFRTQPFIERDRVVIVGQSAGGFGAIAISSRNPEGVLGVINFAGGRGSLGPNNVCMRERLVDAMARYGKTARLPSLWLYAENDLYFWPELARGMFDAYRKEGGRGEFVAMPAHGMDGHLTFATWSASRNWTSAVERFLKSL